jgi:drug/metabolite transporter (DMT)-like permease
MTGGFAVSGFVVAQLAYRDGQLGGPLATITLVEPLVAGILGVTVLGERLQLSPVLAVLGPAGVVSTALGVRALSRPGREPGPPRPARAPRRSTAIPTRGIGGPRVRPDP